MSRIDKLAILGVRSFDNRTSETIQFHTPLTLIVGYNGSGKTTIIECLKYATTGDLPPNSKGGAFVHDPQMCREKEVMAQVKLSFKGTDGSKIVCTRSLQVTMQRGTRAQKTLEGQLLVVKNGERSTISSKCADMNAIMLHYLGVSKAILEYVIFCHQDESLWPMSEPATLKKRFDEIFEALKYTNVIKTMKDLIKKQKEELAQEKIRLEQYRTDKDRAERAEKKSRDLHAEVEALREQIQRLDQEIAKSWQEAQELFSTASAFEATIAALNGKRQQVITMEETIGDLKKNLEEVEDSDEDLINMQRDYAERMRAFEDTIQANKQRLTLLQQELVTARKRHGAKLTEQGRATAEKTAFERQVARRVEIIKETSRRHNIRGFEGDLDDTAIQEFMERLNRMYKEQAATLDKVKRETREEAAVAQGELNRINSRRSNLLQSKDIARNEIRSIELKAASYQSKLDDINVDEGQEALQKSIMDECSEKLRQAREAFERLDFDKQARIVNSQLREVEDEAHVVTEELGRSTRQADDRAKLGLLKKEQVARQKALDALLTANAEKFAQILGDNWKNLNLEREVHSIVEQRGEELTDTTKQRDGINNELSQVEAKIGMAKESIKEKTQAMKACQRKVLDANEEVTMENYPQFVAQVEEQLEEYRGHSKSVEWLSAYLASAITMAEKKDCCALCARRFGGTAENTEFIKRCQTKLKEIKEKNLKEEMDALESDLKDLKEVQNSYDTYIRLRDIEIPSLDESMKKFTEKKRDVMEQLDQAEKECSTKSYAKLEAESLKRPILDYARYQKEIVDYENQIQRVSSQLQDVGGARTIEEMQESLKQLNEKAQALRTQISSIQADKERQRQSITILENDLRDCRERLTEIKHNLEKSQSLKENILDARKAAMNQKEIIEQADRDIEALVPDLTKAQAKFNEVTEAGLEREKKLQKEASRLFDSLSQLKTAYDEIEHYINSGKAGFLERCIEETNEIQEHVKNLEEAIGEITTNLNKYENDKANAKNTEQKIINNLRYRQHQENLKRLKEEIRVLEAQNAEADRDSYQREAKKKQDQQMKLSAKRSETAGIMKTKDNELVQLVRDFEVDFRDAKDNFRKSTVKVQTTKAAIEDLTKYSAALDKAIMKYHSLKMEEINRIIDELWKTTYRGTDVDTIMIRSEPEDKKSNRSYNYRVCMVKQDAEMDMRGRCSAGQKVLACIIIRLALAECFGVNCGLIALDEPTTNLDRDNIKSLAKSLSQIINARQKQDNFQLIVITHDEEFLRYMSCSEYCDHYYRVSRDERQKSIIEMNSISEVI